jgi:hypothetical protein
MIRSVKNYDAKVTKAFNLRKIVLIRRGLFYEYHRGSVLAVMKIPVGDQTRRKIFFFYIE